MGIVDEDVARVRAATDFVGLAGEHVGLKKVGRQWQGLCPFHAEKSPSFSINAELGVYHCFGCGAGGDVISFVRDLEHLTFVEAVERLAGRAGIALRYDDGTDGRDRQRRNRLLEAMAKAVDWYHQRLLNASDAAPARGYLRSRGYDGEIVRTFRLGWAPGEWDALSRALALPDDVMKDTGLAFVNRMNRQQDAFRSRVMFPIFDPSGNAVAFGGRILPGGEGPKYKNSQETPIYSKRRVLYGLNWAKGSVVETGEAIVCEGYTDVIGFFTAGLPRAVATCGTALADEHVRLLKNFAPRVVLAYDADGAGQAAAERFYAWEQKEQIDISVAAFPAGADPGDLARNDPAALKDAVERARPFLAFRVERVLAAAEMRTPEGRARAAAAAMEAIAEHPNELVRDQYIRDVADRCRIDPTQLRALRGPAQAGGRRQDPA
ncbi:MAG: primase, partial [Acidimicrobiaceae bacterium]|nr:primase [Acidimicrobiaceae bacterium]